jgi:polysaccharide pyruvyl transferase WcaK-like protein
MIIEIRKVGFINKGAELMLHAILSQIKARYPRSTLVMAPGRPSGDRPFNKVVSRGFYLKSWLWYAGIQWGDLAIFIPKQIREMYGLILDREVDVVLDAAGFSYSDQWGLAAGKELARSTARWRKRNTKIILLPQAFGPFEHKENQNSVREWVSNADIIFAREDDSYSNLIKIVGNQNKIKKFPDFTILVKGTLPAFYDSTNKRVALIPNFRMIDKTNTVGDHLYISFMVRCAKYLVQKGAKPFVLIHEGYKDQKIGEEISAAAGGIPLVNERDPLIIKGIIGTCDITIGSRYHGLISALSQGVPSLATGWSHKYLRLFEEYNFKDGYVSVEDEDEVLYKKIDDLLHSKTHLQIKKNLLDRAKIVEQQSIEMWNLIFESLDSVEDSIARS